MNTTSPYSLDPSANKQPYIWGACCTVYVAAVTAVVLRLVSRKISNAGYRADDFFIIVALVFGTGLFIDIVGILKNGLGEHLKSRAQYSILSKWFNAGDAIFACSMAFTKFSILFFYWRIFGRGTHIKWPLWILAGLVSAWLIENFFIPIFHCTPVAKSWDMTIETGHCIDYLAFTTANLVINFVTDLMIIALPIPFIWRLQQSTSQKIMTTGMFLLGGFVCMISVIRLTNLVTTDFETIDIAWAFADFSMWYCVEANIAIVSACLPSLRPILTTIKSALSNDRLKFRESSPQPMKGTPVLNAKWYGRGSSSQSVGLEKDTLPLYAFQTVCEKSPR